MMTNTPEEQRMGCTTIPRVHLHLLNDAPWSQLIDVKEKTEVSWSLNQFFFFFEF